MLCFFGIFVVFAVFYFCIYESQIVVMSLLLVVDCFYCA